MRLVHHSLRNVTLFHLQDRNTIIIHHSISRAGLEPLSPELLQLRLKIIF